MCIIRACKLVEIYAIIITLSRRVMYDDYDLDYTFSNDYNLDEDAYYEHYAQLDALDLDEEYTRDAHDYDALAYRHYA
jgi:hypothetical protein